MFPSAAQNFRGAWRVSLVLTGLAAVLGTGILASCESVRVRLADDSVTERRRDDRAELGPFAVGSTNTLTLDDVLDLDVSGWTVTSSNPAVLGVSVEYVPMQEPGAWETVRRWAGNTNPAPAGALRVTVSAQAPGAAELQLQRGPKVVRSHHVSVKRATRMEVLAAGPLLVSPLEIPAARVTAKTRLLEGQPVHLVVRCYAEDELLAGAHEVAVSGAGVTEQKFGPPVASTRHLQVRLVPTGQEVLVTALLGDPAPPPVRISVARAEEVASLTLQQSQDDDAGLVWAEARDSSGAVILGVAPHWTLDAPPAPPVTAQGNPDEAPAPPRRDGEVFAYVVDPHARSSLQAAFGSLHAQVEIAGREGNADEAELSSCQNAPDAWLWPLLGWTALWVFRRGQRA